MLKKILIFIIIILILVGIAISIQIYLGRNQNTNIVGEKSEQRGGIFGFLGFGDDPSTTDPNSTPEIPAPDSNVSNRPLFVPTLRQITTEPIAGATFVGTSTIRYVDRGVGHIYEIPVDSYDPVKLSNNTLPKVYRAHWLPNGDSVVIQQLDESSVIKTSLIELINKKTGTSTGAIYNTAITFLPDNIEEISISPTTNEVSYLESSSPSRSSITITNGETKTSSFSIPGKDWIIDWINTNNISLTTKASAESNGHSYQSNRSGLLTKILGNVAGLTTKTKSDWLLYSESKGGSFTSTALNLETESTTPITPTTLPEKCAFLDQLEDSIICGTPTNIPNGQYPDLWYQGLNSFTDDIVLYNLNTGSSKTLYTPQVAVDIINPSISSDGKYFIFTNKKDLTLWALNTEEAGLSI